MSAGKGDRARNNSSQKFRDNYDEIFRNTVKKTIGFYSSIEYTAWYPVEKNSTIDLVKGDKIKLDTLFGKNIFIVDGMEANKGVAYSGDLGIWLQKIDGFWHYSSTSFNRNGIAKAKIV